MCRPGSGWPARRTKESENGKTIERCGSGTSWRTPLSLALGTSAARGAAPALWGAGETFLATIENDSRGGEECLLFKGQDTLPQRYNWGPWDYCGYLGGKQASAKAPGHPFYERLAKLLEKQS